MTDYFEKRAKLINELEKGEQSLLSDSKKVEILKDYYISLSNEDLDELLWEMQETPEEKFREIDRKAIDAAIKEKGAHATESYTLGEHYQVVVAMDYIKSAKSIAENSPELWHLITTEHPDLLTVSTTELEKLLKSDEVQKNPVFESWHMPVTKVKEAVFNILFARKRKMSIKKNPDA